MRLSSRVCNKMCVVRSFSVIASRKRTCYLKSKVYDVRHVLKMNVKTFSEQLCCSVLMSILAVAAHANR